MFRYSAVLEPGEGRTLISTDTGRAFVLSYHLADQTLAVFEPSQVRTPASGIDVFRLYGCIQQACMCC